MRPVIAISQTGILSAGIAKMPLETSAEKPGDQFGIMFYKLLLQTVHWTPGVRKHSNEHSNGESALFGDMMTDCLAREAAKVQQGYGQMLLSMSDKHE